MVRRAAFVSMSNDDDSEDHITSYCSRCESFGFLSELKERIYPDNEPKPSDSDNWLQCHRCSLIVAKIHAKRKNEIIGIKEPEGSIYDSGKTIIKSITRSTKNRREFIKNLNRPDHRTNPEDTDKDLHRMLKKQGTHLISYTEEQL